MLSDLMGCHSVYAKGYRNVFEHNGIIQADKMREGCTLARGLLEPPPGPNAGPMLKP